MNRSARRKLQAMEARAQKQAPDLFRQALDAEGPGGNAAAIVLYQQCIAQDPNNAEACFRLAGLLRETGDLAGAIVAYRAADKARPAHFETLANLAEVLRQSGRAQEALPLSEHFMRLDPKRLEGLLIRGLIRKDLGDIRGSLDEMGKAVALHPHAALAHKTMGRVLADAGCRAAARASFEAAARLDPKDGELYRLLGVLYHLEGDSWRSFVALQKAVELDPQDALAYSHMAGTLSHTDELQLAVSSARVAIQLNPLHADARFNLAAALERQGKTAEALQSYMEALACKQDLGDAYVAICRLKQQICDWSELDAFQELAPSFSFQMGKSVPPFAILSMPSSSADQLQAARAFATSAKADAGAPLSTYAPRPAHRRSERIRVGYLSADLHAHATAALIAEVFEFHDKSRFETFAYSIGRQDESAMRRRLVSAFDHFKDIRSIAHADAAAVIRRDEIDILVDLKGYTFQSRPEILAHRPAPIQVNYLGYPGTMGASFIDYIVGDEIVTPAEHASFYDERIVTLPNSYQPNDRKRAVAAGVPSRSACGLPEDGFIFCCFNANYKLTAGMFDRWMRILAAVPGSVLWLLQSNADAADNLQREAAERGIDPDRLVFAPKLTPENHLARMRNGDLFLDTQPVGAHTTASEALWVGLPVLTCLGDTFIARVAASLLHAVDLPELVLTTPDAYEAEAIRLATDRNRLASIRKKLQANVAHAPLFDTPRYVRNLEAAFDRMVELKDQGLAPQAFAITEPPTS